MGVHQFNALLCAVAVEHRAVTPICRRNVAKLTATRPLHAVGIGGTFPVVGTVSAHLLAADDAALRVVVQRTDLLVAVTGARHTERQSTERSSTVLVLAAVEEVAVEAVPGDRKRAQAALALIVSVADGVLAALPVQALAASAAQGNLSRKAVLAAGVQREGGVADAEAI